MTNIKFKFIFVTMYIDRELSKTFKTALRGFPAIFISGPRQSGKTTLLLYEMKDKAYHISFDDPLERDFAINDPQGFLEEYGDKPAILDEIQYVPGLMPYLKLNIDRNRQRKGKWILTGSQQFQLMRNISESLAGRIAILELLPFSVNEKRKIKSQSLEKIIWEGTYPEPSVYPSKRNLWMSSYIQTYIERDIRQLINLKDLRTFENFISLAAANHGQLFNTASLSRETGVSLPTIKSWGGVLNASYICAFLPPFFKNYGKRITKTPKFYFLDSALVCVLTKQPDGNSAVSGAMGGMLFEGLIISETIKAFTNRGEKPVIFFWRSHDGLEVDLIIRTKAKLLPVEIKLTATPSLKHMEPLNKFKKLAGDEASKTGVLVCRAKEKKSLPGNNTVIPWQDFPQWLKAKM